MPLFWNGNFNNPNFMGNGNNFINNNSNQDFNNQGNIFNRSLFSRLSSNQRRIPNQQINQPFQNGKFGQAEENGGITFNPITEEELEKINDEIKQNIENNKNMGTHFKTSSGTEKVIGCLKDFIQDERNGSVFYSSLSNLCNNEFYKNRLKKISEECNLGKKYFKDYYKTLKSEEFEPKELPINVNINLKNGLILAIEEEMKSYDKICTILDEIPSEDSKYFYKMALKKLNRINFIQYMVMNKINF